MKRPQMIFPDQFLSSVHRDNGMGMYLLNNLFK